MNSLASCPMACDVRDADTIVRFDNEKRIKVDKKVHWRLMEPEFDQDLGCFAQSVTYVDGLCCAGIVEEGEKWAKQHNPEKPLTGWAEFDTAVVADIELQVYRDDDPPRHGNITGWSEKFRENRNQKAKDFANRVSGMRVDQISC